MCVVVLWMSLPLEMVLVLEWVAPPLGVQAAEQIQWEVVVVKELPSLPPMLLLWPPSCEEATHPEVPYTHPASPTSHPVSRPRLQIHPLSSVAWSRDQGAKCR